MFNVIPMFNVSLLLCPILQYAVSLDFSHRILYCMSCTTKVFNLGKRLIKCLDPMVFDILFSSGKETSIMAIERNNKLLYFHSLKEETSLSFLVIIIMLMKYM